MYLLFNMLSRLVIGFLPSFFSFNFMAAVTIWRNCGAQANKSCQCFHCFPIYYLWSDYDHSSQLPWHQSLECCILSQLFHSPLSHLSTGFLGSFSFSVIRVMSPAYLRLLIFLLATLIHVCASSSPAIHMMYCKCKLNKQSANTQPWRSPVRIVNQSIVPIPVITMASWPPYRFLRRRERWPGIPVYLRIFHSLLWPTAKGFSAVNEAEVDGFLMNLSDSNSSKTSSGFKSWRDGNAQRVKERNTNQGRSHWIE